MKRIAVIVLLAVVGYAFLRDDSVHLGPGVRAAAAPQQRPPTSTAPFEFKGYTVTPLAQFRLKAKVLSREDYRYGREADLSPMDLALGWGPMSDERILSRIDITQSGRWYRWQVETLPIPRVEIETHSANMHLIPADDTVAAAMDRVRRGELVAFAGMLVRVDADRDGWHWISSLTRTDTGGHACELVWVQDFEAL